VSKSHTGDLLKMTKDTSAAEIERQRIAFLQKLAEMARKDDEKKPSQDKEKTVPPK
jgi:uncharacterized tellurite resistance protein B-like protein